MDFNLQSWSQKEYTIFIESLKSNADVKYREFNKSTIPTKKEMIGIRVPALQKIAKDILKGDYVSFLDFCGDIYYEEILLEGMVIAGIKGSYDELIGRIDLFIDKIDNWSICDCFCSRLKIVKKYRSKFWAYINKCITSENYWKIRVGLVLLLDYYIDTKNLEKIFNICDSIKSEEYYVKMAVAWLVSFCYIKYPEVTEYYLRNSKLDNWTHNKAIQKTIESRRITEENRVNLRQIKK